MIGVQFPHAGYRDTLRSVPEVEIVGFYDPDPALARSKIHPSQQDIPVYDDVDTLVKNHSPEAAMVFLPNNERPAVITKLANAGIHIMAEKPIAMNAPALKEAKAAIEKSGVVFYTGYQWRRNPLVRMVKEYVDKGY